MTATDELDAFLDAPDTQPPYRKCHSCRGHPEAMAWVAALLARADERGKQGVRMVAIFQHIRGEFSYPLSKSALENHLKRQSCGVSGLWQKVKA